MPEALVVNDLWKSFGGVPVLKGVDFRLRSGHLTSLAGENGAGKSTLMNIITGQLKQDRGSIVVGGDELAKPDPRLAKAMGVGIVPQELAPYPDLTIYENIFVGREFRTKSGLLDRPRMIAKTRELLTAFELELDPRMKMDRLSVALTQVVEIVKATSGGASVLLLDEPTSSIPEQEVDNLYSIISVLKAQGVAMLYTTHRMDEMQQISDDIVVLRDGQLILEAKLEDASEDAVVKAMIGRDLGALYPEKDYSASPDIGLKVENLRLPKTESPIELEVRRGEILGLAGLVGAGRTEMLEAIYGVTYDEHAKISVDGSKVDVRDPRSAIEAGIALVPEDRKGAGLILSQSVRDNGSLPHIDKVSKYGWIKGGSVKRLVEKAVESVSLRYRSLDQDAETLSGGNQQKIVLARWLTFAPKVLLLDEPTRGVDVGARGEIYQIVKALAAEGIAVIVASSDMAELIGISHRILVVKDHEIVGEIPRESLEDADPQEQIFRLASGQLEMTGSESL